MEDEVSTRLANVDMEAESTRSTTRAMSMSGSVSSIEGTMESYAYLCFSGEKNGSGNSLPKLPRK